MLSGSEQPGDSGRNNKLTLFTIVQPSQGVEIQVIVMIVAEQHYIDAGKILPMYARWAPAARTDPGERTCPRRPDRIGQDVDSALLQQHRGMVDQRNPQLVAFHRDGGFDGSTSETKRADGSGRLVSLPPKDIEKAARLRGARIEEALSIEMLRKRR